MTEKTVKIAIIEDDLAIVQMYKTKFEKSGYDVGIANDGVTGLQLVSDFKPQIILLDIEMPQLDGIEVLRRLRNEPETASIKVIILTNQGDPQTAAQVLQLKADDYIVKAEASPKEVEGRVRQVLGKARKTT